jgi:transposase
MLLGQAEGLCGWWHRVREGTGSWAPCQSYARWLRGVLRAEFAGGAGCACPKTAATWRELLKVEPALGTFVRVPGSEPTNKAAERGLRHAVQWRKTSYGTDRVAGSHVVANVLAGVARCRQQERDVLDYLTRCCQAWYANTAPPSLLPQRAS